MNWSNVQLVLLREVRDQLRDRRTLFMIFVLPILLYPLLGLSFFQMAQFIREQPTKVLLLGHDELPASPRLLENAEGARRFAAALFSQHDQAELLEIHLPHQPIASGPDGGPPDALAHHLVAQGDYELVIYFPPGFRQKLADLQAEVAARAGEDRPAPPEAENGDRAADLSDSSGQPVPNPKIYFNTAKEKSALAYARAVDVLHRWTNAVVRENLAAARFPDSAAEPFDVVGDDAAESRGLKGAALWSKILPFLLLIWALTGAFYPAIDLCAGEKERGTLETLLISPAARSEIVCGKLLTVMLFSMGTAILNLVSVGVTGQLVLSQLPRLGPPPPLAPVWLLIALVPISALFSALCLALAAFARSTKEGQYYLMPLLLVTMPLVVLPMSPGFELTLGNSLIPVSGVMLVLRALLEGNYWQALPYVPVVLAVTLAGSLLAIRWAVDQFNDESVLFRESERFELGLWLRHLLRERQPTPRPAEAVLCGVLILVIQFFLSLALSKSAGKADFAVLALTTQLAVIAAPALLMTVMLTTSPRQTLLLRLPPLWTLPASILLAVALHPVANVLQVAVQKLYPINEPMKQQLAQLLPSSYSFWLLLLVVAVVPAVCEELAFRGFILSGLRRLGHRRRAIVLSSLFFGMAHLFFQQSLVAFILGLVIGYLAVQTGSLLPGILFHFTHNALALASARLSPQWLDEQPFLGWLVNDLGREEYLYQGHVVALGGIAALALLLLLRRLPRTPTREERLQEAIGRRAAAGLAR